MQDRTPKYPGRVKMVPVPGTENTYTLTRADEPEVGSEGTPLNKATFLTDEAAALFALTGGAVPDDVFKILGDVALVRGGALNRANGEKLILPAPTANMAVGSYVGTGAYGSASPNELTFDFTPRLLLITGSTRKPMSAYTPNYWILQYPDSEMRFYLNIKSGITWGENSVSWWSESIPYADSGSESPGDAQLNESGVTYHYIAFGDV